MEDTLDNIRTESGADFDPDLARLFVELEPELRKIIKEEKGG